MRAKILYPGIAYFELAKEMPMNPIGSMVQICDADGRECLKLNGLEMSIDAAMECPDWFIPVTVEERRELLTKRAIDFFMSQARTEEEAKAIIAKL